MDSWKLGFLEELAYFWNNFLSTREDIVLIVCGSVASYMLKKVIHNKGSLHGRVTDIIEIEQFDMMATKELFVKQGCNYSDKSIKKLLELEYLESDSPKGAIRLRFNSYFASKIFPDLIPDKRA